VTTRKAFPGSARRGEVPGLRLTVLAWLRGRLTDIRRSDAACRALCEHDDKSIPCRICAVRYW